MDPGRRTVMEPFELLARERPLWMPGDAESPDLRVIHGDPGMATERGILREGRQHREARHAALAPNRVRSWTLHWPVFTEARDHADRHRCGRTGAWPRRRCARRAAPRG